MKVFKMSRQFEIETFKLQRDMRFGNTYSRENSIYVALEAVGMDRMKNVHRI